MIVDDDRRHLETWTPALTQLLASLWNRGKTGSYISKAILERTGVYFSRNAVISKANRIDLMSRPSPISKGKAGRLSKPQKMPIPSNVVRLRAGSFKTYTNIGPAHRTCQFIEGDGYPWTKCGCATHRNSSWCEAHYARVFQPRAAE